MPHPALPPNPCLLAILLVVKSRNGPNLVFHYPPNASVSSDPSTSTANGHHRGNGSEGDDSDDSESATNGWSSDNDDGIENEGEGSVSRGSRSGTVTGTATSTRTGRGHSLRSSAPELEDDDSPPVSEDDEDGKKEEKAKEREWDRVLGYSAEALAKLLCPVRGFNRRRYEVCLEDIVLVGCPMFVREDGRWKKKKKEKKPKKSKQQKSNGVDGANGEEQPDNTETEGNEADESDARQAEDVEGGVNGTGSGTSNGIDIEPPLENGTTNGTTPGDVSKSFGAASTPSDVGSEAKSTSTKDLGDNMSMFHVCCVIKPPILEYHLRVKEMFDNIAKKYAKFLRSEQSHSGYVWKEAKKIMQIKEHAKQSRAAMQSVWPEIMHQSPLARSIAIVFDAISVSKIAHIHIDDDFDTSLQIPQAISTPFAPTPNDPQMPGLWLTTDTLIDDDDADTAISPRSALLLLEDAEVLLKEVESDTKNLKGLLSQYLRITTPTKSLQKLATKSGMHLVDVQQLTRHLIYWRRGRAIPPLNQQDTYIVSPNADMTMLPLAISAYATRFPTLPPLPTMLHLLSREPRPYLHFIPSKEHRAAYYEILAWLLRGGWVTQLRTFAWVRVSAEVKAVVAAQMRRENSDASANTASVVSATRSATKKARSSSDNEAPSTPPAYRSDDETAVVSPRRPSITSPRLSAFVTPARPPSEAGSTASNRTAVPVSITAASPPSSLAAKISKRSSQSPQQSPVQQFESLTSSTLKPPPSVSSPSVVSTSSPMPHTELHHYYPSLVQSPHKANALESRWLDHIGSMLDLEEHRNLWPVFVRYFDGRHALEEIAPREGMKRKKALEMIAMLRTKGILAVVRHW